MSKGERIAIIVIVVVFIGAGYLMSGSSEPMSPCNVRVGNIYYKCPETNKVYAPDLGDCKDYLTGKDLQECELMYYWDKKQQQDAEKNSGFNN